ncbi:hypothetical protein QE369_000429 [Agrobacterium larrymoorei]|uniref:Uncharacterized protein n=1 Tax=Agrobacterium larrymoorei TaxID=160699 RepID=A0AAJ2BC59_9HYPH|nr:hypothetical protein [Agrobacterium larrymoorei]
MIEALQMYDHYLFRVAAQDDKETGQPLELKLPPQAGEAAWLERDWADPVRARDRNLFARAD